MRLRAVRAHSVKMGPDMHCCRSSWPISNVPASLLHSRSLPMRTKLGDQQYQVCVSRDLPYLRSRSCEGSARQDEVEICTLYSLFAPRAVKGHLNAPWRQRTQCRRSLSVNPQSTPTHHEPLRWRCRSQHTTLAASRLSPPSATLYLRALTPPRCGSTRRLVGASGAPFGPRTGGSQSAGRPVP